MTIRRGPDTFLPDGDHAPIQLGELVDRIDRTWTQHRATLSPHDAYAALRDELVAGSPLWAPIRGIRFLQRDQTSGGLAAPHHDPEYGPAHGLKLFTNFALGADLLVVPPGTGFPVHVHPGHHLLLCMSGVGTFSLAGHTHAVEPGELHMVEGNVPHAVGNPTDDVHVLLAIGAPPKELDAEDRMVLTDWQGLTVETPATA